MKELESSDDQQDLASEVIDPIAFPYEISFADSESSPATCALIETQLLRMQKYFDHITHAKIFVRIPHKQRGLRFYHIHVQLDVPGKSIVVSREPEANTGHSEMRLAVKDAFDKVQKQLEHYVRLRKSHKEPMVREDRFARSGLSVTPDTP